MDRQIASEPVHQPLTSSAYVSHIVSELMVQGPQARAPTARRLGLGEAGDHGDARACTNWLTQNLRRQLRRRICPSPRETTRHRGGSTTRRAEEQGAGPSSHRVRHAVPDRAGEQGAKTDVVKVVVTEDVGLGRRRV